MTEVRWTAEQAAAIQADGHTVLRANAGTGKTTTVIAKILWHLGFPVGVDADRATPIPLCPDDRRIRLPEVAAITFTEKAAHDLKQKLREELLAHDHELVWEIDRAAIGTIHGFCGDLLREHALRFGIDPGFRVLDERDARLEQDRIIRDVILDALHGDDERAIELTRQRRLAGYQYSPGMIDCVRHAFRDLRWHRDRYEAWSLDGALHRDTLEALAETWSDPDHESFRFTDALVALAREVDARWTRFEQDEHVRDFDSLILSAREILAGERGRPALEGIRRRCRLLIIDEFQDTDGAQRDIAFAIAGIGDRGARSDTPGPQLFVVGDPKQSIYGFRGADVRVWNQVTETICGPNGPLQLTRNFRSAPEVVDFVNTVCQPVLDGEAFTVHALHPGSEVPYTRLVTGRAVPSDGDDPTTRVEWLETPAGLKRDERLQEEAERVAARIRDIVIDGDRGDDEGIEVIDRGSGESVPCQYRHIAILFRSRAGVDVYERALRKYDVPFYLSGDAGLIAQQEVLDLLTLLRVIDNPRDDLQAFAFLRSPFVGLRDETIARIRMEAGPNTLLRQARQYVQEGRDWSPFPGHPGVESLERTSLEDGIRLVEELIAMRTRAPIDRIVEEALDRTGYRLHLYLLDQPEPRMANIQRFVTLLQGYRHHTVGSFLELWEQWENQDLGIPQAPLYSKDDDVVTLSTIHGAKGLEWPVVILVDSDRRFMDRCQSSFLSDRDLGPVFCPRQDDRGLRTQRIASRKIAEDRAEEARLLYVALTRARDRLIVSGPSERVNGVQRWLVEHRGDALRMERRVPNVKRPPLPAAPGLEWVGAVQSGRATTPLTLRYELRHPRRFRSATELMTRRHSRDEWMMKYVHGVIPRWHFAPDRASQGIPANVRGTVVHGVLERIQEEAELADLLDLAIGTIDEPDLEERLAAGGEYRAGLEEELRRVVASPEWRWYVEGEHYRELWFVHFRPSGRWRIGAFDLYRLDGDGADQIVDFKTHEIEADEAAATARPYALQAAMYRRAATALRGDATVRFHFTRPNVVVPADEG